VPNPQDVPAEGTRGPCHLESVAGKAADRSCPDEYGRIATFYGCARLTRASVPRGVRPRAFGWHLNLWALICKEGLRLLGPLFEQMVPVPRRCRNCPDL
jgi:hypothetical protein